MLDAKEIKDYIIDRLIRALNKEVDIYDPIIQKKFYSLLELINLDNKLELEFGLNVDLAQKFKPHIIQIKINALNEVKKNIQNLQNKHVINYREHFGSLNTSLKNVNAFLNHCSDVAHYIPKITKKVLFNPTIKDIVEIKRSSYTNEDYKKILDNIDLIKFTPKKMKPTKYHKDILKDENDIYYINLEIDIDDDKTLKTISSFRKIPIHSELEEDLLNYIKSVKTNHLFKIKSNYFSIEFGHDKLKEGNVCSKDF